MALFLNAYNALAVAMVIDNRCDGGALCDSIRDIGSVFSPVWQARPPSGHRHSSGLFLGQSRPRAAWLRRWMRGMWAARCTRWTTSSTTRCALPTATRGYTPPSTAPPSPAPTCARLSTEPACCLHKSVKMLAQIQQTEKWSRRPDKLPFSLITDGWRCWSGRRRRSCRSVWRRSSTRRPRRG